MMRSDTSPVKERLTAISSSMKNVTFTGCGNTLADQSKQENKAITLVPEARVVPTGIARIVELEDKVGPMCGHSRRHAGNPAAPRR